MERMEQAVGLLPGGDLWWRPHDQVLSVGTILLHLEGNLRQWILCGLGAASSERDRASEFSHQSSAKPQVLLEQLAQTAREAAQLIRALDPPALAQEHTIQGFQVTGQAAALHVLEHFSWHLGQVVWIAKARSGRDHGLAFYDEDSLG